MKNTEVKFEAYDEKEADALFVEDEEELVTIWEREEEPASSDSDYDDEIAWEDGIICDGLEHVFETKERMKEWFYDLGSADDTDEERKQLLIEDLDMFEELYTKYYGGVNLSERLSDLAKMRERAKELFAELGVA